MKRTLLAVGIAVLVSMMLAPHGDRGGSISGWGPFFYSDGYFVPGDVGFWWYSFNPKKVMIDMLALEIVFLAVLFSVVANIRWRRKWAFIILTAFVGVVAFAIYLQADQTARRKAARHEKLQGSKSKNLIDSSEIELVDLVLTPYRNLWGWFEPRGRDRNQIGRAHV